MRIQQQRHRQPAQVLGEVAVGVQREAAFGEVDREPGPALFREGPRGRQEIGAVPRIVLDEARVPGAHLGIALARSTGDLRVDRQAAAGGQRPVHGGADRRRDDVDAAVLLDHEAGGDQLVQGLPRGAFDAVEEPHGRDRRGRQIVQRRPGDRAERGQLRLDERGEPRPRAHRDGEGGLAHEHVLRELGEDALERHGAPAGGAGHMLQRGDGRRGGRQRAAQVQEIADVQRLHAQVMQAVEGAAGRHVAHGDHHPQLRDPGTADHISQNLLAGRIQEVGIVDDHEGRFATEGPDARVQALRDGLRRRPDPGVQEIRDGREAVRVEHTVESGEQR